MSIQSRVEAQKVRVSMNTKHLTIQSGDKQLVQLEDGRYRELPVEEITFHREGDFNDSPWTRFYNLSNPDDARHITALRKFLKENPSAASDVRLRVRIAGEFESGSEPWPGYDEQGADEIVAYYHSMPGKYRPTLETIMQYELCKLTHDENGVEISATNDAKVVAIETLDQKQASAAKAAASAGVKM